jgi:hypothetical protein
MNGNLEVGQLQLVQHLLMPWIIIIIIIIIITFYYDGLIWFILDII